MKVACSDRTANLIFTASCLVLVGMAAVRLWPHGGGAQARENFLERGTPDPFELPDSIGAGPSVCVFVTSDCSICDDSLPFYGRLTERAMRRPGGPNVIFVSMEPKGVLGAYLERGGVANPHVASIPRPLRIPGSPCIVMLDGLRRVEQSWAGRLSRRQEREVEALVLGR